MAWRPSEHELGPARLAASLATGVFNRDLVRLAATRIRTLYRQGHGSDPHRGLTKVPVRATTPTTPPPDHPLRSVIISILDAASPQFGDKRPDTETDFRRGVRALGSYGLSATEFSERLLTRELQTRLCRDPCCRPHVPRQGSHFSEQGKASSERNRALGEAHSGCRTPCGKAHLAAAQRGRDSTKADGERTDTPSGGVSF